MVKEYFVKEISYNKGDECNEDVFAAKKEKTRERIQGDWKLKQL